MQDSQDLLTQADKAIGDGDHGIGMARGFAAVQAKLEASPPATVADLLKTTGMALLTSIGGASGVIFGTLFRGGARNLTGVTIFNSETLSLMLTDGLAAVQERGKANPGDKTMVDALTPAAAKAAEMAACLVGRSPAGRRRGRPARHGSDEGHGRRDGQGAGSGAACDWLCRPWGALDVSDPRFHGAVCDFRRVTLGLSDLPHSHPATA